MVIGKVFLVGAGSGDPKLLTLKAAELLQTAEVVIYDRLVSEEIISLIPDSAEKIYVGKEAGNHVVPQEKITALLVEKALAGRNVVRLKGGDPFIFGRGGEEAEELIDAGVPFEETMSFLRWFLVFLRLLLRLCTLGFRLRIGILLLRLPSLQGIKRAKMRELLTGVSWQGRLIRL
jgi:hypothetical protein